MQKQDILGLQFHTPPFFFYGSQVELLLEAKINTQISNSNMTICKKLVKICPECVKAYVMLRTEALKNEKALETTDDAENDGNEQLVVAFNDTEVSDKEFEQMLEEEQGSRAFARLGRMVTRLS
ncbi:MAG: hypothetical protein IKH97_04520 [Bacteroidales bacterium]|nr:hypothetical protein [Bacteroidales bacterium]